MSKFDRYAKLLFSQQSVSNLSKDAGALSPKASSDKQLTLVPVPETKL
jgi:hypothetical protein